MAKESSIEGQGNQLAFMVGWANYKGQATDRNGAADRIYMKQGRGFVVEWKKPGGRQRKTQKTEQKLCVKLGIPYYVCSSLNQFRKILLTEEDKLTGN